MPPICKRILVFASFQARHPYILTHSSQELQMFTAADPEMSARRRKDSASPEVRILRFISNLLKLIPADLQRNPLKDFTETNGHIPRQVVPTNTQSRGLFLVAALLGVAIAVSVLNHLEIQTLRQLNEEVVRNFIDEERSLEADASHGRPRVWIEGKKVSIIVWKKCVAQIDLSLVGNRLSQACDKDV